MNIQENIIYVPFTGNLHKVQEYLTKNPREGKKIGLNLASYISAVKKNEDSTYEFRVVNFYCTRKTTQVTEAQFNEWLAAYEREKQGIKLPKQSIPERLQKNLQLAQKEQNEEKKKGFNLINTNVPDFIRLSPLEGGRKIIKSTSESIDGLEVGIASCEGRRYSMEDNDLSTTITFKTNGTECKAQLFGIFDGHGGNLASQYVKENLPKYLNQSLEKADSSPSQIWDALKECFAKLHEDYTGKDGTTATVALIVGDQIWVANVGDSRTVLCNHSEAIQLSDDAKPLKERFLNKIEDLGGFVFGNRVGGYLNVARAVGDKNISGISPKPKITVYPLSEVQNGYLVLACDGLYDVTSTNEVSEAINQMDQQGFSVQTMAKHLVYSAIMSGSGDNVSVMIIKLKS